MPHMQPIFDEIIKESVAPFLKLHGFKKRRLDFYKRENGLVFLINFQKASYNSWDDVMFFINCGIYSETFAEVTSREIIPFPKSYDCLFERRMEAITGLNKTYFRLQDAAQKILMTTEIVEHLEKVLVFYRPFSSLDSLIDHCIEHNGLHRHEKIFRYLSIQKDNTRIALYMDRFVSYLVDDEERKAMFVERIKVILKLEALGRKIKNAEGTTAEISAMMEEFDRNVLRHNGSSLFFYPEDYDERTNYAIGNYDPSVEEVVRKCLDYEPIAL
jgi:Domain of unknown function (DUF4304)